MPGDVIGVFDPGIFSIGDTLCDPTMKFDFKKYQPLPRSILPELHNETQ